MSFLERVFPALAEPTLRRYLTGQAASVLGNWTQNVTLNLLVYDLSGSGAVLALLNFLLYGPQLVVPPIAGARITSSNARRATLMVLVGCLIVTFILAGLAAFHVLTLPVVMVLAVVIGVLSAIESPARQVLLVSSLKDAALLPNAVAMNTMVYNMGRMIGPSIAAIVYPVLGPAAGFLVYALGLVFMASCVRSMEIRVYVPKRGAEDRSALRDALAYVLEDRFTAKYLSILACLGLLAASYPTLVPVLADHVFHDAATYTGVFFACAGLGSICAAVLLSSSLSARAQYLLQLTPWTTCVALAMLATNWNAIFSGMAFCVLGFSLSFSATSTNATIQGRCPEEVRGALVGLYGMAYIGTMPFGYLLLGSFSEAFTVTGAFAAAAGLLGIGLAVVTAVHWRKA